MCVSPFTHTPILLSEFTRLTTVPQIPDQFVDVIHRHFPDLRDNLPPMDLSRVGQSSFKYDSTKATRELGIVYTALETMVMDSISSILALRAQIM
jgi:hypothetical protein